VIQVYVPVRDRGRTTLPKVVCAAMDVTAGGWVRVSVLDDGRVLLERVAPHIPEPVIIRGAVVPPRPSMPDEQTSPAAPPCAPVAT
jgi:bifunctional DNA-binding transcriptional regulator/antitoxin component of YhaV-PrlF toxin-antitoxin module